MAERASSKKVHPSVLVYVCVCARCKCVSFVVWSGLVTSLVWSLCECSFRLKEIDKSGEETKTRSRKIAPTAIAYHLQRTTRLL